MGEDFAWGFGMDVGFDDGAFAEGDDGIADGLEVGFELVDVEGVEGLFRGLEAEEKFSTVAKFEDGVFGKEGDVDVFTRFGGERMFARNWFAAESGLEALENVGQTNATRIDDAGFL